MTDYITSDTHFDHSNICGPNGFTALRERESPRFQSWDESDMLKN